MTSPAYADPQPLFPVKFRPSRGASARLWMPIFSLRRETFLSLQFYPSVDLMAVWMRLVTIAIGAIGILALVIIGAAWVVAVITPAGVIVGFIAFFVVRKNRRQNAIAAALAEEAQRNRELNRREYAAWQDFNDESRRRDLKRRRALRKFDNTRDPPSRS